MNDPSNIPNFVEIGLRPGRHKDKDYSRNVVLDKYKKPASSYLNYDQNLEYDHTTTIRIIKYFADSYLSVMLSRGYDLTKPISTYFPEISIKELTGQDLVFLSKANEKQYKIYMNINAKEGKKTPLSILISHYGLDGSDGIKLSDEHFSSSHLYRSDHKAYNDMCDKSCEEGEEFGLFRGGQLCYSKRIYMNLPKNHNVAYRFGELFIKKCIDRRIPFDMKLFGALGSGLLDNTILYSKNAYFKDHIEIIEEIMKEHPEYKQYMGSPIYTAGRVKDRDGECYYALSNGGECHYGFARRRAYTYNDLVDFVVNSAYLYTCMEIIKENFAYFANKFDKKTINEMYSIMNSPKGMETVMAFDKSFEFNDKVIDEVRKFVDYKKETGNDREVKTKMCLKMYKNIKDFKSIIIFGDLDHKEVPMYKNKSFLLWEGKLKKERTKK